MTNPINCEQVRISAMCADDGEVGSVPVNQVDGHLSQCEACRVEVERQRLQRSLLSTMRRAYGTGSVWSRLKQVLHHGQLDVSRENDDIASVQSNSAESELAVSATSPATALQDADGMFSDEGWPFSDADRSDDQTQEHSFHETRSDAPLVTLDELTGSLVESGLSNEEEIQQLFSDVAEVGNDPNARTLAERMVANGRLTNYQARVLLRESKAPLFIDKYLILETIGSGSSGIVLKAVQQSMDRVVALKVLPKSAVGSHDKLERFHREARAAAQLDHPNIVTGHDAGEWNGLHFLVMEYFDGHSLADVVTERGALSVEDAVNVTLQAARGLAHAHERGVIHRDIKPANLVVDDEGEVKVVDLGLATIETGADSSTFETMAGSVIGTAAFMSPEQGLETKDADQRSDIYSLGATLFFLLHGKPPYQHPTVMQTLRAHCDEPIPSLCRTRTDVPEQLDLICRRMLEKDRDDRFQSADEVVAALESLANGQAVDLPRPSVERRTSRIVKIVVACVLMLFSAAVAIHIVTDEGDLIVISDDPGIKVLIKRGERLVEPLTLEQGETKTTIRSGSYVVELLPADARRFSLDRQQITISRGEKTTVTVSPKRADHAAVSDANSPVLCDFKRESHTAHFWVWNDEFAFSDNGATAPRGPASWLRSRHLFGEDVSIELDFSLGPAKYSNTGAASVVLWGKRIPVTSRQGRLDVWMQIRRDGNDIVVRRNDDEPQRIALDLWASKDLTPISIHWRSRSSHFRRIRISGDCFGAEIDPPDGLFMFQDKRRAEAHWSWNEKIVFAADGAMSPRGPASFLRSRNRYGADMSIDMNFSLGEAAYSNTGDAWITVWGQRIRIAKESKPLEVKLHIHREQNEIVFRLNDGEQRVPIESEAANESTSIELRWRSRTAHFRRIEIQPEAITL